MTLACLSCSPPRFSYMLVNGSGSTAEVEYSLYVRHSSVGEEDLYPKLIDSADFGDNNPARQRMSSEDFSWQVEKMPPEGESGTTAYANSDVKYHVKLVLPPSKSLLLMIDNQPGVGNEISLFRLKITKSTGRESRVSDSLNNESAQNDFQESKLVINCHDRSCNKLFSTLR